MKKSFTKSYEDQINTFLNDKSLTKPLLKYFVLENNYTSHTFWISKIKQRKGNLAVGVKLASDGGQHKLKV